MRSDRVAVFATATLVVLLTLGTGPSVGILSVPEGGLGEDVALGTGTADVTVVAEPARAELAAGSYGEVHYLSIADTTVEVTNVTGSPTLTVAVDVDDLGYSRSSVFVLDESGDGLRAIGIGRGNLDSHKLERDSYQGQYRIVLRDARGRTVVYDEPIVIEVTE